MAFKVQFINITATLHILLVEEDFSCGKLKEHPRPVIPCCFRRRIFDRFHDFTHTRVKDSVKVISNS